MLPAAEVMAVEIGKSTIEIDKAILGDKNKREAVVAALEEMCGIPHIERTIYATKLAKENELMVGFLSHISPSMAAEDVPRCYLNVKLWSFFFGQFIIIDMFADM
ncbi:hypothetical protein Sjap_012339 [Stephania japonica]|uniref:Uncharacterized protein n=1 Tax=Stephania japonica TaxID=461633 RepID=A0AAP0NWN9_9MAGN